MKSYQYDYPRPALTADVIIFSYFEEKLRILLIQRGIDPFLNCWALPGGFVNEGETDYEAAIRELEEETHLQISQLTQFFFASKPGRDPRGWTVSSVFIGFETNSQHSVRAGDDAKNLQWFPINELPSLAFDHSQIIEKAKNWLIQKIFYTSVEKELLPSSFYIEDLYKIYQQLHIATDKADKLMERISTNQLLIRNPDSSVSFNVKAFNKVVSHEFYL